MRLDKFLKVARIIKRRPIAKVVIDGKKAKIDGREAKAGTEVRVGNVIELEYYDKYIKFEVKTVPAGDVPKDKAATLIDIKEIRGIDKSADSEEVF